MRAVRERCVWSQAITHRDLVPYLIEEAYELIEAVETGSREEVQEELGDLLWQVLFHAAIAAQDAAEPFDIDDVARSVTEKMVRRHPHVFGDAVATTPEEVLVHWNAAKAAEKRSRRSALDGIPRGMPALALAQKMLGRVSSATPEPIEVSAPEPLPVFDTSQDSACGGVPLPLLQEAQQPAAEPASEAELGEALLALVAMARARGLDAERALRERLRLLEDEVRTTEPGRIEPWPP